MLTDPKSLKSCLLRLSLCFVCCIPQLHCSFVDETLPSQSFIQLSEHVVAASTLRLTIYEFDSHSHFVSPVPSWVIETQHHKTASRIKHLSQMNVLSELVPHPSPAGVTPAVNCVQILGKTCVMFQ